MGFVYVGLGSVVETSKIIAIADYSQSSIQELVERTDSSRVVDLAKGHKVKSVVITDGELVLCSRAPEVITRGMNTTCPVE